MSMPVAKSLYWSVHREIWENRSLYIAPLVAAAIAFVAFFSSLKSLPHFLHEQPADSSANPAHQHFEFIQAFGHVTILVVATAFIVGVFYCLDALHGERRDRSILFWKSLPVSDVMTVLSKASIPLVVLPLIVFFIVVTEQSVMLLISTAVSLASSGSVAMLWERVPLFQMAFVLFYCLLAQALWHAPIYAWLLLISVWARRTIFIWALLPPLAICVFEKIALNTTYFASLLGYRLIGVYTEAMRSGVDPHYIPVAALTPAKFLSAPGLWVGLAFAAIFLAAAARLRRHRGPI